MEQGRDPGRRLGALFDRVVSAATGRNRGIDLRTEILRAAEQHLSEGPAGPTVPNAFRVSAGEGPDPAGGPVEHLEAAITEAFVLRGRRFEGPVTVTLAPGGRTPVVDAAVVPGELPTWGSLGPAAGGPALPIRHNRAVIGRAAESDVEIAGAGVSRRHALVWREAGRVWVADLQSSNGTLLNGDPVYDVVEVRPRDVLLFGEAAYVFGAQ